MLLLLRHSNAEYKTSIPSNIAPSGPACCYLDTADRPSSPVVAVTALLYHRWQNLPCVVSSQTYGTPQQCRKYRPHRVVCTTETELATTGATTNCSRTTWGTVVRRSPPGKGRSAGGAAMKWADVTTRVSFCQTTHVGNLGLSHMLQNQGPNLQQQHGLLPHSSLSRCVWMEHLAPLCRRATAVCLLFTRRCDASPVVVDGFVRAVGGNRPLDVPVVRPASATDTRRRKTPAPAKTKRLMADERSSRMAVCRFFRKLYAAAGTAFTREPRARDQERERDGAPQIMLNKRGG